MTEPQFRSKGPELLVELSQHVADTVKNVTELIRKQPSWSAMPLPNI